MCPKEPEETSTRLQVLWESDGGQGMMDLSLQFQTPICKWDMAAKIRAKASESLAALRVFVDVPGVEVGRVITLNGVWNISCVRLSHGVE